MWNTFSTHDLLERIPENVGQLLHKLLTHKDPRECETPSPHTAHSSCPVVLSPIGPAPAKWVQGPPQRSPWSLPIPVGISRYSRYTMGYLFNEDFFFWLMDWITWKPNWVRCATILQEWVILLMEQKWSDFASNNFKVFFAVKVTVLPPKNPKKSDLDQSLQYVSGLALETVQSGSRCL